MARGWYASSVNRRRKYKERKEKGLCVECGKEKEDNGTVLCDIDRKKKKRIKQETSEKEWRSKREIQKAYYDKYIFEFILQAYIKIIAGKIRKQWQMKNYM